MVGDIQSGGSVGSMVVVGGTVVGGLVVVGGVVVGALVVVGGIVDGAGLASGGVNSHTSKNLNKMSSTATYPFPLFPRLTTNSICEIQNVINKVNYENDILKIRIA